MLHKGTVILETERRVLRRFTLEDAKICFTTRQVTKYLAWSAHDNVEITKMILDMWVKDYASEKNYQ